MSVNESSRVALREEEKHDHEEQRHRAKESSKERVRIRLIPIPLRIVFVLVLIIFSVFIGAVIGYSVLGDGRFVEVFFPSTWTHIIDLVNKGT